MVDGVPKGDMDVVEECAASADEVVLAFEAESVESGDIEVAQQLLARGIKAEGPGVRVGAVLRGGLKVSRVRTVAGIWFGIGWRLSVGPR